MEANRTLSQKLDLAIATLDRLVDAPQSESKDKAVAKWQEIKRRIEAQVKNG